MKEFLRGFGHLFGRGGAPSGPDLEAQARKSGVTDEKVLAAMARVPRAEFMPENARQHAHVDSAFPIGEGQTISQPTLVARMTEHLKVRSSDKVLEVGAGSGYQAAILSRLASRVHAVEIVPGLASSAAARLARLGFANVRVHGGDGFEGLRDEAPFDAIMVSCAVAKVPEPLADQLKTGGRMVLPLGAGNWAQILTLVTKLAGGEVSQEALLPVQFVPLTGPHAAEP